MSFEIKPLIIGHRGAAGLAPENTLASFAKAYELGVDAVELDVYSIEGELIVFHDDRLERTTNGQGPIQQQALSHLRDLDAGNGQTIPLLTEVLDQTPQGVGVNIELKGRNTAEPVARCLADFPKVDVLVSSFRHTELARFHALDTKTRVAPLLHRWPPAPWRIAERIDAWAVNLSAKLVTKERVAKIHAGGYRCFVYTINRLADAQELTALGVDGVFTDRPDLLVGALRGVN